MVFLCFCGVFLLCFCGGGLTLRVFLCVFFRALARTFFFFPPPFSKAHHAATGNSRFGRGCGHSWFARGFRCAIRSAHVVTALKEQKEAVRRRPQTFFVWSNWKGALTADPSQDAELEHTPRARVHPRGRSVASRWGFENRRTLCSWEVHGCVNAGNHEERPWCRRRPFHEIDEIRSQQGGF